MTHTHTHTHTHIHTHIHKHSLRLLWTRDRPVTETSTLQQTPVTRDRHPCLDGIRSRNSSKTEAGDLRLRPRGQRDRYQETRKTKLTQIKKTHGKWSQQRCSLALRTWRLEDCYRYSDVLEDPASSRTQRYWRQHEVLNVR